jgi:hypothetical protein
MPKAGKGALGGVFVGISPGAETGVSALIVRRVFAADTCAVRPNKRGPSGSPPSPAVIPTSPEK